MRTSFSITLAESKRFLSAPALKGNDFSKSIYRSNGFEAWVVGETETAWLINDFDGVKCKIHKHTTKRSIFKVSSDYTLRK